jgi:membrane protease subunit HflC
MKRNLPSMIAGVALVLILGLYMITYQVRFNESAVISTFGKATEEDVVKEAGLKWKWPFPIQRVTIYDQRLQTTSTPGEETSTQDGKTIIVTTAIGWRIDDPYVFRKTCTSMKDAADKLISRVRNDQKTVIGHYDFANFVSIDPQQLQFEEIERELLAAIHDYAQDKFGIDVQTVRIEKLALPQKITEDVFAAMKKERQAIAARYTSEGESRAKQIQDTAEGIAGTILTFADRKAAEIIAQGQAEAAKYNETFRQDEKLAVFLLKIKNLAKILEKRTTLILDADQQPLDLLRDMAAPAAPRVREAKVSPTTRPVDRVSQNPALMGALPDIIEPR